MTTFASSSPSAPESPSEPSDARVAFSAYHRHRRRGELARRFPVAFCMALALAGLTVWTVNAEPAAEAAQHAEPAGATGAAVIDEAPISPPPSDPHAAHLPGPAAGVAVPSAAEDPAAPAVAPLDTPVAPLLNPDGSIPLGDPAEHITESRVFDIAVTSSGHQAEIDACAWVRVDVGAVAPIVGAHNNCGGHIVLEMRVGDTVHVSGEGLDGVYRVGDERAAQAGQIAATATAGMNADLIAQTCLWEGNGHLRLLSLVRVKGIEPLP